jgi:predicted deacylase
MENVQEQVLEVFNKDLYEESKLRVNEKISIPYFTLKKGKGDSVVMITTGMHADEINGINSLRYVIKEIAANLDKIKKPITFIPLINRSGFEANKRKVNVDKGDINRSFDKDGSNTTSAQIAQAILGLVKKHRLNIDLHCAGKDHMIMTHLKVHTDFLDVAKRSGYKDIVFSGPIKGSLTGAAARHGIPSLTFELGGGQSIERSFYGPLIRAIKNLLIEHETFDGEIEPAAEQYVYDYGKRENLYSPVSGIMDLEIELAQRVKPGEAIGCIYDPVGHSVHELTTKIGGVVYTRRLIDRVHEGARIVSMLADE